MGTRHLICAVVDGEMKLAQYGQWDGYPSGQGLKVLNFCRDIPVTFADNLRACRFGSDAEIDAIYAPFSANGWMDMEQAEAFKKSEFAHLSRDTGADILPLVAEKPRVLVDSSDFASDDLFCEWAYYVDMDARELRVTNGAKAAFSFDDLPSDEEFLKMLGD